MGFEYRSTAKVPPFGFCAICTELEEECLFLTRSEGGFSVRHRSRVDGWPDLDAAFVDGTILLTFHAMGGRELDGWLSRFTAACARLHLVLQFEEL